MKTDKEIRRINDKISNDYGKYEDFYRGKHSVDDIDDALDYIDNNITVESYMNTLQSHFDYPTDNMGIGIGHIIKKLHKHQEQLVKHGLNRRSDIDNLVYKFPEYAF